ERFAIELTHARTVISAERRVDSERDEVRKVAETCIRLAKVGERLDEQAGAGQQEERECHLRGNQEVSQSNGPAAARNRTNYVFQRAPQVHADRLEGRRESEEHRGREDQRSVESQDAPVGRGLD